MSEHDNVPEEQPTAPTPPLLIVDRCPVFVGGLTAILNGNGYDSIQVATSFASLQEDAGIDQPDDAHMLIVGPLLPTPEGFAVCRWAMQRGLHRIIFISADFNDPAFVLDAPMVGVSAALPVDVMPQQLLQTVSTVLNGNGSPFGDGAVGSVQLSARELDVVRLWAEGKTDKDVAEALQVKLSTARTHAQRILVRLNVHNRRDAIHRARHHGLI